MILERFYDDKLAQASYLIGCAATGEGLIIDPNRDIEAYVRATRAAGVRITHVTETHIHADYVSGSRELARSAGATLFLSDEGNEDWKYLFAEDAGAILLNDGDSFDVGKIHVDVVHTPGHTPEHVTFLVTDTAAADAPMAAFTGDFLFVGDVGRPDLLEKAAKLEGTMEGAARDLFRSLQAFRSYPDYLAIYPGHGAGSACGKGISSVPNSTLGYERRFNWAFSHDDEDEFVREVLEGQPEAPKYFAEMKRINREGPPILDGFSRPERLRDGRLGEVLGGDEMVVDTRNAAEYAERHVPGTVNIPLNRSFNTWAGWLVPYGRPFYLIIDDACEGCLDEAIRDLALIGLDDVAGYFDSGVLETWAADVGELQSIPQMTSEELARRLRNEDLAVLDVRGRAEWEAGHLPGVENIPVGYLTDQLHEIPRDRPLVMHCQAGGRSAIAASLLRSRGFDNVFNLKGGYGAWEASGNPTERAGSTPEPAAGVV